MRRRSLAAWIALLLIPLAAIAADKDAAELDMKMQRVIVFKDGYSLIIKRATATTNKDGEVFTDDVPDAAVLGSFWAVPDEGRLVSMLSDRGNGLYNWTAILVELALAALPLSHAFGLVP